MRNILFVCTGNTCRSPMAEGICRILCQKEGLHVDVRSAGVSAWGGLPISGHTAQVLMEHGFNSPLESNEITPDVIEWADLVLTMTFAHKEVLVRQFPEAMEKIFTLKEYAQMMEFNDEQECKEKWAFISEMQLKRALNQELSKEELEKLNRYETAGTDYDIDDPFGGTLDTYRETAVQIEQAILKIIEKWKTEERPES